MSKSPSQSFYTLRDRVKERWIYLDEKFFPICSAWTTYRRIYDDSDVHFLITKVLDWNKVEVEVYEGDYEETFITQLSLRTNKECPWYYTDKILTDEFEVTDEMREMMSKICVSVES